MDIRPEQPDFRRNERLRQRPSEGAERPETREADESNRRTLAARIQNARIQSARVQNARSEGEADRIDLSEGARAAEGLTSGGGTPPDRLAALRELYQSGKLNSPERLEIAAARILGNTPE